MRLSTLGIAAVVAGGLAQPSQAFVRPKGAEKPIVAAERGPRTHRTTKWNKQLTALPGWTAIWDHDTDVPLRLWGSGVTAAGAVANAATAEAAARQFLAAHIAVLAPGSAVSDFELVGNRLSRNGDVRSVGFAQRAGGLRVVGGAIGFSFKNDRLVMVSSTALPHVVVPALTHRLAPAFVNQRAVDWLATGGRNVAVKSPDSLVAPPPVIIPIVRPRVGADIDVSYRVAEQVVVESPALVDGAWDVWIDASDGSPIARRTRVQYASGQVLYNTPDRYPGGGRSNKPAAFANHQVNGSTAMSTLDGMVTWSGTAAASVSPSLTGPFVRVFNDAGSVVSETLNLAVGGMLVWDKSTSETSDAQLSGFVHASIVKEFAKTRIDPSLEWLDTQLAVSVNESGSCNAFSSGDDIHFLRKGQCENTARLADVVYHEFGHSLHHNAIIEGVGQFDGGMSEGMSDVLSALLTRDSGLGRGFFMSNEPLRQLNPQGTEKVWPDDATGEVHDDGEIIGGTMWDTWMALEQKLGQDAGYEKMLDIYYGVIQRGSDIPSAYAEALVADDDDGDITNGTPNQCEINLAFGKHGLADPAASIGIGRPLRDGFTIKIPVQPSNNPNCPTPSITSAVVNWSVVGGAEGTVDLAANGNNQEGAIPAQPEGSSVQYKVTVTLSDGMVQTFPNNPAEPFYQFYVGATTPLWCSNFENGLGGMTLDAGWDLGAPLGMGGDPKNAVSGNIVIGTDLSDDGEYDASVVSFAETPEVDLKGNTKVRLQFQRWLGVEDGFYDHARILANGTEVWANHASPSDPGSEGTNHLDKEWQFRDFDLSSQAASGKVKVRFELAADEGLQLGGWTLDDVCIVAMAGAAVTCGNNTQDEGETCDDGNRIDGDGCSANCSIEDGTGGGGDGDGGGCCSVGTKPQGAIALALLTLGLLIRRRRR
ncbi:MAG: MYXO-CTERM sorting domain-containing protein [Kofleriaceae bacterium]